MMRRPRGAALALFSFALGVILAARPAAADGNTTAFTVDGLDARAFAMGGTLVALPKDASAVRWNPALLVFCSRPTATAGWSEPAAGLGASHAAASVGFPVGGRLADAAPGLPVRQIAAGVMAMSTGFDLSEGDRWSETQVGVGVGYAFNPYMALGTTVRLLTNGSPALTGTAATGYSVDLGAAVLLSPNVELAGTVHNALGRIRWKDLDVSESPPNVLDAGAAFTSERLKGEVIFEISSAQSARAILGAEYGLFGGVLDLRAGARALTGPEARVVPTAGLGLRVGHLHADVGASLDQENALGTTGAASIGYSF